MIDENVYFHTKGRSAQPFQVFLGGRGVGKTFSTLCSYVADEKGNFLDPALGKFMYIRETANEIKICTDETANPFKKINKKKNWYIYPEYSSKTNIATFYREDLNNQREAIGYGVGLSTFANLRGADFSDVTDIVYDEFIKQKGGRRLSNAGSSLLHLYETVNRNREFDGETPVIMKLLANSVSLNSDILLAMNAVSTLAHMVTKHQARATIPERKLYLELIDKNDFRELKEQTVLYQLTKGTSFSDEALDNVFVDDDMTFVRKVPLNEYVPFCSFGTDYSMYKHKTRIEWYIAAKESKSPIMLTNYQSDFLKSRYRLIYEELSILRKVYYDSYGTKLVFDSLMGVA